jgi:hypothetical protein
MVAVVFIAPHVLPSGLAARIAARACCSMHSYPGRRAAPSGRENGLVTWSGLAPPARPLQVAPAPLRVNVAPRPVGGGAWRARPVTR